MDPLGNILGTILNYQKKPLYLGTPNIAGSSCCSRLGDCNIEFKSVRLE